jgi:hypothetical protein
MTINRTGPNGQVTEPLHLLDGPTLRRMLQGKGSAARAEVAARLIKHKATLTDLSPAQVARLCGATPAGVSNALGRRGSRGPHAKTINTLVKRYGPDTLMRALDSATAPSLQAAE